MENEYAGEIAGVRETSDVVLVKGKSNKTRVLPKINPPSTKFVIGILEAFCSIGGGFSHEPQG